MTSAASSVLVCAVEGTELTKAELNFYKQLQPAGVTLFGRNIPKNYLETLSLCQKLQSTVSSDLPMIIAIDQEGGRVARIKSPFPDHGPAMAMARGQVDPSSLKEIEGLSHKVGAELLRLGINVNFAPCVDILTEPANVAIGDRAFGIDVEPVVQRSTAWLDGLQSTGVLGCLKHFPGQGDAKVDTHAGQARMDLPRSLMDQRELIPFRALLPKVEMVMVSHGVYPQIAPEEASRSPKIIGGLLRGEMGFEGVVVSDDMNMGALPQDRLEWQGALVDALMAGCDMLLVCRGLDRCQWAYEALTQAAQKSKSVTNRLQEASTRMKKLRSLLKC